MRHITANFTIVSAYRKELSENVNMANHLDAVKTLTDAKIPHKEVYGYYNGDGERSILIVEPACQAIATELLERYGQESYLFVDCEQQGTLVYADGSTESLGKWQSADPDDATAEESYTVDPDTGRYYICKK